MFWECHIVSSSVDKLLDQPLDTVKLQDFLDESDLIQECLTQNKRLIDYLIQSNIMNELIGFIIHLPKDENFRNAYVVTELLSGDFQRIQEKLLEKEHLDLLYSFLLTNSTEDETTLNPILASYFSRILMSLIIRKPNELLTYLKSRQTFKQDFLNHLYSTSIADVLCRLIADCGDLRSETIKWYEDINLIDDIIEQLLRTDSAYVQMNIVNLLSEFLRLAFDQSNGIDQDIHGNMYGSSLSTLESFIYNKTENNQESSFSNQYSSNNNETEGKLTPLTIAQHILSKSNLEQLFDSLSKQPKLVANGCDFLVTVLDLFCRYMPAPLCISLLSTSSSSNENSTSKDASSSSSDKDENERMQINDEGDPSPVIKSSNETNANNLENLSMYTKDSLIRIYLILLEVIPSRLPALINLLSKPSPPLIPSSLSSSPSHDSSQAVKYQFISEPLGPIRLNLIKFFSKLIQTISNDYTGDSIYQILDSNHLLHTLIDLFHHHIYNNFLHTQVSQIIRHILHINSLAVKQPNDIWTRTPLPNQTQISKSEFSNSSPYHYTNRYSYKIFQTLLTTSEVNLVERLLDQYETNLASSKSILTSSSSEDAITSSLLHTRFASPNSGHITQILRYLREYASVFNNYSSFFKNDTEEQIDDNTNMLEIRWQTALDYLNEDEKKCSAMHQNDRNSTNQFRINSASTIMAHINNTTHLHDSSEASYRRQTFHMRSYGNSGPPYIDDDDDDAERFDIDDEVMNNEQNASEQKTAQMKKISFDPQFPPVFDEQSFWRQHDDTDVTNNRNDNDNENNNNNNNNNIKMTSNSQISDLFGNYRTQQEKSGSSNESNFEELCSLRANDHGSGPVISPFQSSSKVHDDAGEGQDEF